ncbi:MAG: Alpha-galactosidase [candidate division BRC1 bacterium ADurb.BinA364]|nr:MAG: Alpha-galactosidase [candidate division BRC1 bacterium ADurb.BinA364]
MKALIIGAGSAFGSRLSIDILSREPLKDSTIALCDISEERLERVSSFVRSAIEHHKLPARVAAGTDRRALLPDCDFVIISVSIGGPAYYDWPFESEIDIPAKYGVRQTVGDTVGPGGIFRALRTGPVMMEIARDIQELCPNAIVLNYTNPMAMLTWILSASMDNRIAGLCHGVQGTSQRMAAYIGAPYEEVGYWCTGINHMAWFTEFTHNGEDAYPRLRQAMNDKATYDKDPTRFDLLANFGYFCTESSRHALEYVPYFRYDLPRIERFAALTKGVKGRRQAWYEDMGVKAEDAESIKLVRSHEYASGIIEAVRTGVPFRFNGNVINDGLMDDFQPGCCVEVPCMTDGQGIHPCRVERLPAQCAALCRTNINVQELTVKAVLERDPEAAFHALLLDPITAAALPFGKARELFEEMWAAEKHLLDWYKK